MKQQTCFNENAIGIDPSGCGCTDCILGDSIPLSEWMDDLYKEVVLGRPVVNRTSLRLCVDLVQGRIRVLETYAEPGCVVIADKGIWRMGGAQ